MLPAALYTAEQTRRLDAGAINDFGIPGAVLMERAGRATYRLMRARWPSARRLDVVCGAGNNGGDGFVIARLALEDGLAVRAYTVGDLRKLGPDARHMLERLAALGMTPAALEPEAVLHGELVVDALFGTGLSREVTGHWAGAVRTINASHAPVISVDIPSGLHADTGAVLGVAVHASMTVTYIGLKQGLLTGDGPAHCGRLLFDDLGVPSQVYVSEPSAVTRLDATYLAEHLVPRSRVAHKGTYGHVLVIGGDHGYTGAVRLTAQAAARAGAGLVSVGTRAAHVISVNLSCPEVMARGVETGAELGPLAARATVLAIGPGLGTAAWSEELLRAGEALELPMVLDADGLNLLAARVPEVRDRNDQRVLTPHPAEAGRLLACGTPEVQADRFAAARAIAARYGGVCVLKGAGSIIAAADGRVSVCSAGNPGLATGGSGDVLTGIVAAFLAQGHDGYEAACLGVVAHAAAADVAAGAGERGMLASDVIASLRAVINPGIDT